MLGCDLSVNFRLIPPFNGLGNHVRYATDFKGVSVNKWTADIIALLEKSKGNRTTIFIEGRGFDNATVNEPEACSLGNDEV